MPSMIEGNKGDPTFDVTKGDAVSITKGDGNRLVGPTCQVAEQVAEGQLLLQSWRNNRRPYGAAEGPEERGLLFL